MGKYDIFFSASSEKVLDKLPKRDVGRIIEAIKGLSEEPLPSGCRKLTGTNAFRIRVGTYRVIYEIEHNKLRILILKVGHRRDVYR